MAAGPEGARAPPLASPKRPARRREYGLAAKPRRRITARSPPSPRRLHFPPPGLSVPQSTAAPRRPICRDRKATPAMNWISNYVRPKINSLFSRREVPENLWTKCPECGTMLFHRELADNLQGLHELRPSHGDHPTRPVLSRCSTAASLRK